MEENDLLHILSVNRTLIQIPSKKFRDILAEEMGVRNPDKYIEMYKKEFREKQNELKKINLRISPLSVGLYNAVIDTDSEIDIAKILDKVEKNGLVSENGIKVTEFAIRYGRFKTALKYTSEYGFVGNRNKPFVSADFKLKVTRGGETTGASFSYYESGRVRFSSGYIDSLEAQTKELKQFFSKHYYKIPSSSEITLNNVTAEFKLGFPLKTNLIFYVFSDPYVPSSFDGYVVKASYNDKKFLYITFSDKFSLVIADTGVIQIQGTTSIEEAYRISKRFFEVLKDNDFLETTGVTQNIRRKELKNTKAVRRLNNQPAPNVTRRGTTCPVARRPNPYSYEGKCSIPGCYIKPNPQGQPCCYTIPKSIKYSKNKVENAYIKAGVKVPNVVRREFGIGLNTNNKPVNVAKKNTPLNIKVSYSKKSGLMIGSRQCTRYTKVGLVDIAMRLKIALPKKITKPILCALIRKTVKNSTKQLSNINSESPVRKLNNVNSNSSSVSRRSNVNSESPAKSPTRHVASRRSNVNSESPAKSPTRPVASRRSNVNSESPAKSVASNSSSPNNSLKRARKQIRTRENAEKYMENLYNYFERVSKKE